MTYPSFTIDLIIYNAIFIFGAVCGGLFIWSVMKERNKNE